MKTVFKGGSVVVNGVVEKADVTVSGDTIEAVAPESNSPFDDAVVYDAAEMTLMPGLHMCHFHGDFGYLDYDLNEVIGAKYPPSVQVLIAARACQILLASGVTSVAGAGCSNDIDAALVQASELGIMTLPRIYPSSTMIGTTGQPEVDVTKWWEQRGNLGTYVVADGPDAFRRTVRGHINRGAKIIKILYSGGRPMGPGRDDSERYLSLDELHAVVATAHERGCKVRAHVAYRERIRECVEAGVDLIDHGDEIDEEIVSMMAERGTFWVPSTLFLQYLVDSHRRRGRLTEEDAAKERLLASMREMVSLADQSGAKILLGDDYGFAFLEHSPGVYCKELTMWARDYGFPPQDVLRWGTENGAALHGLADRLGVVKQGALADLLVVRGNPLLDLSILERPEESLAAVVVGGEFHKNELSHASMDRMS